MDQKIKAYKIIGKGQSNVTFFSKKILMYIEADAFVVIEARSNKEIFRSKLSQLEVGPNQNRINESGINISHTIIKSGDKFVRIRFGSSWPVSLIAMILLIVGLAGIIILNLPFVWILIFFAVGGVAEVFNKREVTDKDYLNLTRLLEERGIEIKPVIDPELGDAIQTFSRLNKGSGVAVTLLLYPIFAIIIFLPIAVILDNYTELKTQEISIIGLSISAALMIPISFMFYKFLTAINNTKIDFARKDLENNNLNSDEEYVEAVNSSINKTIVKVLIAVVIIAGVPMLIFRLADPKFSEKSAQEVSQLFMSSLNNKDTNSAKLLLCNDVEDSEIDNKLSSLVETEINLMTTGEPFTLYSTDYVYGETQKINSNLMRSTYRHKKSPDSVYINIVSTPEHDESCIAYVGSIYSSVSITQIGEPKDSP